MGKMVCRVRDHVIHHEGTTALPQDRHRRLACPWDGYVGNCLALHGDNEHNTTDLTSVKPKEIICRQGICPVASVTTLCGLSVAVPDSLWLPR